MAKQSFCLLSQSKILLLHLPSLFWEYLGIKSQVKYFNYSEISQKKLNWAHIPVVISSTLYPYTHFSNMGNLGKIMSSHKHFCFLKTIEFQTCQWRNINWLAIWVYWILFLLSFCVFLCLLKVTILKLNAMLTIEPLESFLNHQISFAQTDCHLN